MLLLQSLFSRTDDAPMRQSAPVPRRYHPRRDVPGNLAMLSIEQSQLPGVDACLGPSAGDVARASPNVRVLARADPDFQAVAARVVEALEKLEDDLTGDVKRLT